MWTWGNANQLGFDCQYRQHCIVIWQEDRLFPELQYFGRGAFTRTGHHPSFVKLVHNFEEPGEVGLRPLLRQFNSF
jgi:hypothetical protein